MTPSRDSTVLTEHSGSGVRAELRDLRTAIANHWPIPPETLAAVPERMLDFVENGSRREATAAARVLVAMARHNAELGSLDSVHSHLHPAGDESKPMGIEELREQNRQRIERLEQFSKFAN